MKTQNNTNNRILSYHEAIHEAFVIAMDSNPNMIMFGEGINDSDGMFGTTAGLSEKYGLDRVFDVPLSETGIAGIAVGAALAGSPTIYCHNRPDFLFLTMDQIINHAAKYRYMSGGQCSVPLVIWAATGQGWGAAAQHSQELHGLFMQITGLKIISPTTPYDVKGMLLSAVRDNNPIMFLDHRKLYAEQGYVPEGDYNVPIGKAQIVLEGTNLSIVAVSSMVPEAKRACMQLKEEKSIDAELIDIRSIRPLDMNTIIDSVKKTGKLLVVDNAPPVGGLAAEIAAEISTKAFEYLKAPIKRLSYPDVPVPASYALEDLYFINSTLIIDSILSMVTNNTNI